MPDLPDYYTQTQISEAEAASVKGGLDANKSATPVSRDIYMATDTGVLYVCVVDGTWTGFDASILTQGILTLYENMAGGGKRITNIANPTAAQDAATRAYVLTQVAAEATARIADVDAEEGARIAADALRLLLAGGTMTGNIAMGGHKVTGLGAPAAQDDALRYNRAEIRNAEIAAAAAIVYSKLNLAASILVSDIAAAEFNVANKLVKLNASADVPDAQIPNLNASKITAGRFPVGRLPAMADEKIWKGTGANVEEVAMPSGWATITVAETEVFAGDSVAAWTDLDLSGAVGAQATLVVLKFIFTQVATKYVAFRKNGDTDEFYLTTENAGCAFIQGKQNTHYVVLVATDNAGVIEWKCESAGLTCTIDIIGYIK